MTIAREELQARHGRLTINVFVWPWLAVNGVSPALLAIEIDTTIPAPTIDANGPSDVDPAFLARLNFGLGDDAGASLAKLIAHHSCRPAFMCLALGSADNFELAAAWAKAGKAVGATFVVLSVLGCPEASNMANLNACDAIFFANEVSNLSHPVHVVLNARSIIGYDMSDIMPHWRGRTGWVERCVADLGELNAILLNTQTRFGRPAEALTLLFTYRPHQNGNQLADADRLAEDLVAGNAAEARVIIAINATSFADEVCGVELAVLFGSKFDGIKMI